MLAGTSWPLRVWLTANDPPAGAGPEAAPTPRGEVPSRPEFRAAGSELAWCARAAEDPGPLCSLELLFPWERVSRRCPLETTDPVECVLRNGFQVS